MITRKQFRPFKKAWTKLLTGLKKQAKAIPRSIKAKLDRSNLLTIIDRANATPNPNRIWTEGEYTFLALTQGQVAKIHTVDYPKVSKFRWTAQRYRNGIFYATAVIVKRDRNGNACKTKKGKPVQVIILMHRLLTNFPQGLVIDHLDHNGLNNSRENIPVVTNQANTSRRRPNVNYRSSQYRGLTWLTSRNAWKVCLCKNYEKQYHGMFKDEKEAATAWNVAAMSQYGKGAFQNEIV